MKVCQPVRSRLVSPQFLRSCDRPAIEDRPSEPPPAWQLEDTGTGKASHADRHWGFVILGLTSVVAPMAAMAMPAPALSLMPPVQAVAAYQSQQAPPQTPLTTVLRTDLPGWDGGHKGFLNPQDINTQLGNPANQGKDAAAVGFLSDFELANNFHANFTPQMITQYEKANAGSAHWNTWDNMYQNAQTNLDIEMNSGLYLGGVPKLSLLSQGQFGDCYFMAALGGVWARNPALAAQMIHPDPDGTFVVTFPGYKAEKLTLTQSELAYAATGHPTAQAQILSEKYEGIARQHTDLLHIGGSNAFEGADHGGAAAYGITLMTGHAVRTVHVGSDDYSIDKMRGDLAQNLPQNLVSASTTKSINGVPGNHVVAVLNYDKTTDTVTLWNPWGWEPSDPAVTQTGNGVFTMKGTDFYHTFHLLDFELPNTHAEVNFTGSLIQDIHTLP